MPRKGKSKNSAITRPYFIVDIDKLFKPNSESIQNPNKETEDLLNASIYSNALKKAIEKAPADNGTFIIGLFGEWGIGKSTIIKNVQADLEKQNKQNYKFIVYDAWKFVKDSFRRAFLLHLVDSLELNKQQYIGKFYTNKSEDIEIKLTFNKRKFWIFTVLPWCIYSLIVISLLLYCGALNWEQKAAIAIIGAFISFVIKSYAKLFDELKINKQTPYLFSEEQFADCFSGILKQTLKQPNFITRLCNLGKGTPLFDKLIIVIDNIDRCSPDTTYELLSTIKTFLINHDNLILIIPVDEVALCEHLQAKFGGDPNRAKEFLRKIFNLEIRIKPLENVELYDFANKTNQDYNLGFSPDAIDIISKEYASNPRRIIQFFNNAKAEWDIIYQRLQNFSDTDIELAKNTMCKLLIIREEWDFYYNQIRQDPSKLLSGTYSGQENKKSISALNIFLKATEFYPVITDESKLTKIISNNKLFDDLPIKTISDLKSLDIDKVASFIKKSEDNQAKIIKYIEKQIKLSLKRDIIGNTVSLFKFTLQTNCAIGGLSNQNNIRLQTVLKGHIGSIVSTMLEKASIEDFADDLISYINMLNQHNQTYIFTEIMDNCIVPTIKLPDYPKEYIATSTDLLYAKLITSMADKKLFNKYKKHFSTWKQYISDEILDIDKIAAADLKYFITDELQKSLINTISLKDNEETQNLHTSVYLLEHYNQNPQLVSAIFDKLNSIYPQYNPGQKSKSIKFINSILSILMVIQPKNFTANIFPVINKLLANRYYGQNIAAHESYADREEYIKVIDLLCSVLNFSLNTEIPQETTTELNAFLKTLLLKLIGRQPDLRIHIIKSIRTHITNEHSDITQLADFVFGTNVHDEDYAHIIKNSAIWRYSNRDKNSPDYYCIDDNKLAAEIQSFLPELNTSDTTKQSLLQNLLDYLIIHRENAVKLAIQTVNDGKIITNLPPKAKTMALQHIYANIGEYESDTPMLKLIAQNGDTEAIKDLVENILLKKMVDPNTKNVALEIFDSIPKAKATKYRKKMNALK